MPRRPSEHQLADRSEVRLREALPQSWVYRRENPDYGIDAGVEIFENDGAYTGLRFLVQLKATGKEEKRSVRIRRGTGGYYRNLDLPVLIVLYVAPRDELYAKWFGDFDPYYGGLGEKTIRFDFSDDDRWMQGTPGHLRSRVEAIRSLTHGGIRPPIRTSIDVAEETIGGVPRAEVLLRLRSRLSYHRGLFSEVGEDATLHVSIDDEEMRVVLATGKSATMHTRGKPLQGGVLTADVMVLIAMVLSQVGEHVLATSVAEGVAAESQLALSPRMLAALASTMLRTNQLARALQFAETILGRAPDLPTEMIATSVLMAGVVSSKAEHEPFVRELLERRIEAHRVEGNRSAEATAAYNLGNHLKGRGQRRDALRAYRKAGAADPSYWEKDYFLREVASLLFMAGRYSKSAELYEMAVEKGGAGRWRALWADALMFSGEFKRASEEFQRFLDEEDRPEAEWVLKSWLLKQIVERQGVTSQSRRPRRAVQALGRVEDARLVTREDAEAALQLDALCVSAWAALAVGASGEPETELMSAVAAMIAAVIGRNDPQLWALAFASVGPFDELRESLPIVGAAALDAVGEAFFEAVLRLAAEGGLEASQPLAELLESVRRIHEDVRRPKEFEVRLPGPGADYYSIKILPEEREIRFGEGREDEAEW